MLIDPSKHVQAISLMIPLSSVVLCAFLHHTCLFLLHDFLGLEGAMSGRDERFVELAGLVDLLQFEGRFLLKLSVGHAQAELVWVGDVGVQT